MTTPLTSVSYSPPASGGGGAVSPAAGGTASAPQSSAPSSPSGAALNALDAAVRAAAATQGGLAELLADLEAALGAADLPEGVQAAAELVLGAQLSINPPPSADDLHQAVAQSGLFLESQLASADAPAEGDLKAALLNLSQALQDWSAASAPAGARSTPPAPPYPGGPLKGQPAQASTLPQDAALEMVAGRLSRQTAGALSRQVLMQAASSPKSSEGSRDAQWLFELPLATPEGASIAQFEIDRDASQDNDGEDDKDGPTWRASFSLDLTGVGPVHARVVLRAGQARVTLWAENSATLAKLEAHKAELAEALQDENLSPQLALFPGAPQARPPSAGRFMDRAV
ncbi:MAG: flagellar hook-length control protein FliK [Caulobacteraceae bacterium]|nr:flagellar hook-length control protein FliK [Caulobacteraceae bacterium]